MKSKIKYLFIIIITVMLCALYVLWADKAISTRAFEIKSDKIPAAFDSFGIVQISDLHNTLFGQSNEKLLSKITEAKPDIIVVTGDVVDSRRTDISVAREFFEKAVEIAPVYYVTGNHEARIDSFSLLQSTVKEIGITTLENESVKIKKNGEEINLCGISDPAFASEYLSGDEAEAVSQALDGLYDKNSFNVLLSHRPEYFDLYVTYGFELVFSGHAHGGQFRLPFVGGLVAPGQGLFPKYDSGLYEKESTAMIVSRGLGNSIIPLRLFNRPEIITVILKSE